MIDGVLFYFHIREEWNSTLGEDACLFDDEVEQDEDYNECPAMQADVAEYGEVDALVHNLTEDLDHEVSKQNGRHSPPIDSIQQHVVHSNFPSASQQQQGEKYALKAPAAAPCSSFFPPVSFTQTHNEVANNRSREPFMFEKKTVKRTASCPPCRARSKASGPLSLDRVKKHRQSVSGGPTLINPKASRITRKKGNGSLRHCAQNLKRIARLSDKDRKELLRVLQRNKKRRKMVSDVHKGKSIDASATVESQSSVNNDWENWLVLHGNEKTKSEDVCEIGKAVGLKFAGDKNNMFDVLTTKGRKHQGGGGEKV